MKLRAFHFCVAGSYKTMIVVVNVAVAICRVNSYLAPQKKKKKVSSQMKMNGNAKKKKEKTFKAKPIVILLSSKCFYSILFYLMNAVKR